MSTAVAAKRREGQRIMDHRKRSFLISVITCDCNYQCFTCAFFIEPIKTWLPAIAINSDFNCVMAVFKVAQEKPY